MAISLEAVEAGEAAIGRDSVLTTDLKATVVVFYRKKQQLTGLTQLLSSHLTRGKAAAAVAVSLMDGHKPGDLKATVAFCREKHQLTGLTRLLFSHLTQVKAAFRSHNRGTKSRDLIRAPNK